MLSFRSRAGNLAGLDKCMPDSGSPAVVTFERLANLDGATHLLSSRGQVGDSVSMTVRQAPNIGPCTIAALAVANSTTPRPAPAPHYPSRYKIAIVALLAATAAFVPWWLAMKLWRRTGARGNHGSGVRRSVWGCAGVPGGDVGGNNWFEGFTGLQDSL